MSAQIQHTLALALFTGTGGIAIAVIAATVTPQWRRIWSVACGQADPAAARQALLSERSLQEPTLAPHDRTPAPNGTA